MQLFSVRPTIFSKIYTEELFDILNNVGKELRSEILEQNIIIDLFNFCSSYQLQQNEDLQQGVNERTNLIPEEAKDNGKPDATLVVIPER